jgi:pyruvate dehydrogenase E2 component (dihydrolipoamide acetyltransferase)
MPKLGLTMEEGLVASWSVKAGDTVKPGDLLFVVETDKIANEVEARDAGTIVEIKVAEGETVPVGAVLATWTGPASGSNAVVGPETDAAPLSAAPVAEVAVAQTVAVSTATAAVVGPGALISGRLLSTPLARRLARNLAIPLDGVAGSGPRGRIKAVDVERHHATAAAAPRAAPAPVATDTGVPAGRTIRTATSIEKTVARRLTESKQTIPHFYVLADADVTDLLALRVSLNATAPVVRISVNHCIVTAVARALVDMPEMNAVWEDGTIATVNGIDVGIAVDSPRGLLVPMLRNIGGIPLPLIAQQADAAVTRARDGKLASPDLTGGVISVSNVGMFGAGFLVPIINPGQSAILGVGASKKVFRPDADGQPVLREEVGLVLSCDHRIHDGVRAARFLDKIVQALQSPLRLLMP